MKASGSGILRQALVWGKNTLGCHSEKVLGTIQKREVVTYLLDAYLIGLHSDCRIVTQLYHYRNYRDGSTLTHQMRDIPEARVHYVCPRIHILLHQKGWLLKHKKNTEFTIWKS